MTLAERLSAWQPQPLRSPLLRALAVVWAAPVSAAGLLAGAASGTVPRLHAGVVLFAPLRGLPRRVLTARGFSAAALGHVVLSVPASPPPRLLAHELVHTRQAERLGPLMAPVYLALLAAYGYRRHPMEEAARRVAARVA